jgi:photosystem II stability/assembly factor-like uncharacterized protein
VVARAIVLAAAAALAGTGAQARPLDHRVLRRFEPRTATTWWAIVDANATGKSSVVRTEDGGRHWRDVTPPLRTVSASAFVGSDAAWIEAGALFPPGSEPVYRTLDGGRSWRLLGRVPSGCELDFVDTRHGWCAFAGAAAGSSTLRLYRTSDGGSSWRLVSRTGLYDTGSTAGALPYRCDKTITFTTRTTGWAASVCSGGSPYLFRSDDGGARWHALARIPLPAGAAAPAGEGVSLPVAAGSRLAVAIDIDGDPGATAVATSANGGRSWSSRLLPGKREHLRADLVEVQHWRFTDGTHLLSTDDGGRNWRAWRPAARMTDFVGSPLSLEFLSSAVGFAVPDGNSGPLWRTGDGGRHWTRVTIGA